MATISSAVPGHRLRPIRALRRLLARPLWRKAAFPVSTWFMPALCVHCRRDRWQGTPLCLACLRKCAPLRAPVCGGCGLPDCADDHAGQDHAFSSVRCLFRIGPRLSTLIHGFKYRHQQRHIRFLCAYLRYRQDIRAWARGFDAMVPVPIHAARLRERGYNQAEKIALEAAFYLGLPVLPRTLIRTRATDSQTKLNRSQRSGNLEKAMACRLPDTVRGKRILIVDDVFTTGATVGRCAELLLAAGALQVGVLALARVEVAADMDDFALEMEAVSSYAT